MICRICGSGGDAKPVESDVWVCNRCFAGIDAGHILEGFLCDGYLPGGRQYGPGDAPPGGQFEKKEGEG